MVSGARLEKCVCRLFGVIFGTVQAPTVPCKTSRVDIVWAMVSHRCCVERWMFSPRRLEAPMVILLLVNSSPSTAFEVVCQKYNAEFIWHYEHSKLVQMFVCALLTWFCNHVSRLDGGWSRSLGKTAAWLKGAF